MSTVAPKPDRKQRKRKLADAEQSPQGVPTDAADAQDEFRKRKLQLLAGDQRDEEMADAALATATANGGDGNDIVEEYEEELVTGKSFNMKKFREKLRDGDFIFELRHFLQTAASNPKVVAQYLKVGGKPLELIQSLEKIDKTQLFHIAYVLTALQLTLIEILSTEAAALQQPAVQACSYLLNSHRACLEKLLHSNVAQHKRCALKLLTAIVTLEPLFGRDILSTLAVVFNADNLERFTRHSKQPVDSAEGSVRTCYIHLVLAYLIEGNAMLVRNLLDRTELVLAVVAGLRYDEEQTVALVLATLQRFVLRSNLVSKTKKVHVFGATVVRHLVQLYEWSGPDCFAALHDRKLADRAAERTDDGQLADVQRAVHEFLVVLLASRKHGIAFQCLGHRRTKANAAQKRVLQSDLGRPWLQPLKAQLAIEVLRACPELMRGYVKHVLAPALDGKSSRHADWATAIGHAAELIGRLEPTVLRAGAAEMSAVEMGQTIKALCMAPELLQQVGGRLVLRSDELATRRRATELLLVMFRQCGRQLREVAAWKVYTANEMRTIRFDLLNHVFVMCPSVEHILLGLHQTLHGDACSEEEPVVAEAMRHLEAVLDLLLCIGQLVPAFVEQTASVINYIQILRPIYELNREREGSTRMELKAVRLMLALEPKALALRTEFCQQVMHSLLNVWRLGGAEERAEARRLLRGVFANTGLFENGALEVDLWLEAFGRVDEEGLEAVRGAFVEALLTCEEEASAGGRGDGGVERTGTGSLKIDASTAAAASHTLTALFTSIEQGVSLNGHIDIPVLGQFFVHFAGTFDATSEPVLRFTESIGAALFHYLPEPHGVARALGARHEHKYAAYMQSWLGKRRPGKLPAFDVPAVNRLYAQLVADDADASVQLLELPALLAEQDAVVDATVDAEAVAVLQNETSGMQLLYAVMFVLCQRADADRLSAAVCTRALHYVKQILGALQRLSVAADAAGEPEDTVTSTAVTAAAAAGAGAGAVAAVADTAYTKALRYVFCSRFQLLNGFAVWHREQPQLTRFVCDLVQHVTSAPAASALAPLSGDQLTELLGHFRTKMVKQIERAVGGQAADEADLPDGAHLLRIVGVFALEHEHCSAILQSLVRLPVERFVAGGRPTVYAELLGFALRRLVDVRTQALAGDAVQGIARIYIGLLEQQLQKELADGSGGGGGGGEVAGGQQNCERLEEALHAYLKTFSHNIGDVPAAELLTAVFASRRPTKATVRLATLLVERDADLLPTVIGLLPAHVGRKELVYPLLNVVCRRPAFELPAALLASVYAEFRNGILKTIEKPHKAAVIYRENVYASLWLVERCMPTHECVDFARRALKCDGAEVFQLQLIKAIHLKALHTDKLDVRRTVFESFVGTAVQLFALVLKRADEQPEPDHDRLAQFATVLADWFRLLPIRAQGATFDKCTKSPIWSLFGKACLKGAMQKGHTDQTAVLLQLLAFLCDRFYADAGGADECARLYEMVLSHSSFFSIALLVKPTETKTQLMHLLYVLAKKNTAPLLAAHVPIFLGAYQARLAASDRYVLAILQAYEQAGVDMHPYRPFFWGESAVAHYAIRGAADAAAAKQATATLYQEPPVQQMMALVEREVAERTLAQFPVWRRLNAVEQVPECRFVCFGIPGNEHRDRPSNAANRLERSVDALDAAPHDEQLALLASRSDTSYADCYDPAFFVPLMAMAFAPESFARCVRPAQNGLLALTFAALSSQDKAMRMAAAMALQRYRQHMLTARFVDSQVWAHLFECVQRGLGQLTADGRRQKKSRVPRVPFVAGCFLARTVNTLVEPLSELYRPLSYFLLVQQTYQFLAVPEFNVLFNSSEVNHVAHRNFVLEVLRDGIKCGSDFTVLMAANVFKALFGVYGGQLATRDTNLLVLTVVNQAVRIPRSARVMVEQVGVLPWLSSVIDGVEFFQFDVIEGVCSVLSNLYYSVRYLRTEYSGAGADVVLRLFGLAVKLAPRLSTRTARATLAKFVNVLGGVVAMDGGSCLRYLSEASVEHLVKCARAHGRKADGATEASVADDLELVRQSDWRFVESRLEYVRRLRAAGVEEQLVFIDATLREVILQWRKAQDGRK